MMSIYPTYRIVRPPHMEVSLYYYHVLNLDFLRKGMNGIHQKNTLHNDFPCFVIDPLRFSQTYLQSLFLLLHQPNYLAELKKLAFRHF